MLRQFPKTARLSDGARRVVAISEVTGMEGDVITLDDIFFFQKRGIDPDGRVVGHLAATGSSLSWHEKPSKDGSPFRRWFR